MFIPSNFSVDNKNSKTQKISTPSIKIKQTTELPKTNNSTADKTTPIGRSFRQFNCDNYQGEILQSTIQIDTSSFHSSNENMNQKQKIIDQLSQPNLSAAERNTLKQEYDNLSLSYEKLLRETYQSKKDIRKEIDRQCPLEKLISDHIDCDKGMEEIEADFNEIINKETAKEQKTYKSNKNKLEKQKMDLFKNNSQPQNLPLSAEWDQLEKDIIEEGERQDLFKSRIKKINTEKNIKIQRFKQKCTPEPSISPIQENDYIDEYEWIDGNPAPREASTWSDLSKQVIIGAGILFVVGVIVMAIRKYMSHANKIKYHQPNDIEKNRAIVNGVKESSIKIDNATLNNLIDKNKLSISLINFRKSIKLTINKPIFKLTYPSWCNTLYSRHNYESKKAMGFLTTYEHKKSIVFFLEKLKIEIKTDSFSIEKMVAFTNANSSNGAFPVYLRNDKIENKEQLVKLIDDILKCEDENDFIMNTLCLTWRFASYFKVTPSINKLNKAYEVLKDIGRSHELDNEALYSPELAPEIMREPNLFGCNYSKSDFLKSTMPMKDMQKLYHFKEVTKAGSKPLVTHMLNCNTPYIAGASGMSNAFYALMDRLDIGLSTPDGVNLVKSMSAFLVAFGIHSFQECYDAFNFSYYYQYYSNEYAQDT